MATENDSISMVKWSLEKVDLKVNQDTNFAVFLKVHTLNKSASIYSMLIL